MRQGSAATGLIELIGEGGDNSTRIAVDGTGAVYVSNAVSNRVARLPAGSTEWAALPFTGLLEPAGIAVDGSGGVYVADQKNNRVVKLQQH